MRDDCRFRSRVAFGNLRRFAGRRTLKFTVRFLGNEAVRPIATPPQFVRVRDGDGDGAADGPRRFAAPQRTA